jgi:hypothetical protein
MADPFDKSTYDTALKAIDNNIKQRLDLIDQLQSVFEGNSNVYSEIEKRLQTTPDLDSSALDKLTAKIEKNMENNRDAMLSLLDRTATEIDNKIKSMNLDPKSDAAVLTRLNTQLKTLQNAQKTIRTNFDANLNSYVNSVKTKIKVDYNTGPSSVNINKILKGEAATSVLGTSLGLDPTNADATGNLINQTQQAAASARKSVEEQTKKQYDKLIKDLQTPGGGSNQSNLLGSMMFLLGAYNLGSTTLNALGVQGNLAQRIGSIITLPISELLGKLRNFTKTVEGYVLQVKAIFDMIAGLGKGLLAIPLRIIQFAADKGHEIKAENIKFFNNLEKFQDSFRESSGVGQSFVGLNKELRGRRISYLDPNNPAARLYGAKGDNLIERQLEESASIIKSMGPRAELMAKAVTRNVTAADSTVANYYYKAKKLMNLSEEDMGKLTNMAISLGKSFPEVFHEISEATAEVAQRFSLDFKMMSADVLTLRKDIVNFGHKSAGELAEVAGHIRQMGVSMGDAMAVFNKFQTFEDAATTAAQLSQTFGMVVDSMELLKAQSPDEILQQYKDAFQASGKSFETMDRFSKSLILQQTGLSDQAAQALFSAENAGKTYEEIMADIEAKDPVKQQTKHMEEMRDAIVELKDTLSERFTSFFDAMQEGFTQKLFENPTIRRSMEKMAVAMDNIFLKFTRIDLSKFQPVIIRMTQMIDKLSKYLSGADFLNKLQQVAFAFADIFDGFTKMGNDGQRQIERGIKSLMDNLKPIYEFLIGIGAEVLKQTTMAIINALPSLLDQINVMLDDVTAYFQGIFSGTKNNPVKDMFTGPNQQRLVENLGQIVEKVFGSTSQPGGNNGLIHKIINLFNVLFEGENSFGKKMLKSLTDSFNTFMTDPNIQAALSKMTTNIVAGIPIKELVTILKHEMFGSLGASEAEAQAARSALTTQSANDLIISEKGSFKLNSKDDVMALKPGGAIEEYMKMTAENSFSRNNLEDLKSMIVDAMTTSLQNVVNNSGGDKELVVNLDSQRVGSVLIKGGLATMMTNPNIAGSQPILNPNSITTANGQIYSSPYRA